MDTKDAHPVLSGDAFPVRHRTPTDRHASVVPFLVLVGTLVVGFMLEATPDTATLFGVAGPPCPSTWLVDAGCPGCGLTRGTALLLDGQFSLATRLQPASWLVVVLAALGALLHGIVLVRGKQTEWIDRLLRTGRVIFVVGLLVVWLARLL